ncbi:MAG TPA: arsenite methyltransferase [Mariniphaga sp.]|nr:arsenite methyltransferase [Mariniphaga sp.]
MKTENIKETVKQKYSSIARQSVLSVNNNCCEPSGCCGQLEFSMIGDEYFHVEGYNADADLGLGCGLPTEFAGIQKGHVVLDLGSGAGNDCFVARSLVGDTGKVIGLDFSEEMLEKANLNLQKTSYNNIEFIVGDIENIPLTGSTFDVVISNCVLNLVPDKHKAFEEIYRVLKPGGHFCISDVVLYGSLPEVLKEAAELYVGCVSGAILKDDYVNIIKQPGFKNIEIKKEKPINIPDSVLTKYLDVTGINTFRQSNNGIFSITISGVK